MEIEEAFHVSFLIEEIPSLDTFEKMAASVKTKLENNRRSRQ
jgi:acyl carrier protein